MTINLRNLGLAAFASTLLGVFIFSVVYADTKIATTTLSGANEVPSVNSTTTGDMMLAYDDLATSTSMRYMLNASGTGITMAHIHCGAIGQNGPIVVTLLHTPSGTTSNGLLASSTVMNSDIATTSNCASTVGQSILSIDDLVNALKAGLLYVNVHSMQFPAGAARGQLMGTSTATTTPPTATTTPPTATTTPPTGTTTPPTGTTTPPSSPDFHSAIEHLRMIIHEIMDLLKNRFHF